MSAKGHHPDCPGCTPVSDVDPIYEWDDDGTPTSAPTGPLTVVHLGDITTHHFLPWWRRILRRSR